MTERAGDPGTAGTAGPPPLTVLITGATGGIGAAAATSLAASGHRLLITGRDPRRGASAARHLLEAGAAGATFLATDHGSIASTRRLVEQVHHTVGALDVLVLNAGAMPPRRTLTPEGLELELAVDVVGPVVLTDGLLPLLAAGPRGRVVFVVSDALDRAPVDQGDPWAAGASGAPLRAYARAKARKAHLAAGLAAELEPRGVAVHAAGPGPAWTPMTRALTRDALGVPAPQWWLIRTVQRLSHPRRAASCLVRAATDPDLQGSSGRLVRGRRSARPLPIDPAAARRHLAAARDLARGARA